MVSIYYHQLQLYHIIVSIIRHEVARDELNKNQHFHEFTHDGGVHWVMAMPKNVLDSDMPVTCFPIFRARPWAWRQFLSHPHYKLLKSTYFGKCLKRSRMNQRGCYRNVWWRQSQQSSRSMGVVSSTDQHHYWEEATTNTSLVQTTNPINNILCEEAIQEQDTCGQIIIDLIKRAVSEFCGISIESFEICPYMILSMAREDKKTGIFESFSNWSHTDNDECSDEVGKLVKQYISQCGNSSLKNYFLELERCFPNYNTKRFPLPTTCCWSLHDPDQFSRMFSHKQHFIIEEAGVSYEISSDNMLNGERQLGGTIYGKLARHLTSCSVWVNQEDGWITTINPGVSATGWGQSGGYGYTRRVGAERRDMILNLITNYMATNNGQLPRLPGVNVPVFMSNVL